MKLKSLYFILLFISSHSFAGIFNNCNTSTTVSTDIIGPLESILIPNCATLSANASIQNGEMKSVCENCISKFRPSALAHGISELPPIDVSKVLKDEFKKNMSENIMRVASLRALNFSGNLDKAINSCDIKKMSSCSAGTLSDLSDSLSKELAHLLANPPISDDSGILKRSASANVCPIPESQILAAKNNFLETELAKPEIRSLFIGLDTSSPALFDSSLSRVLGDKYSYLKVMFTTHPILSHLIAEPAKFKAFFQGLPANTSKVNVSEALYNNPSVANLVSESISNSCNSLMQKFEKYACGKTDYSKGVRISDFDKSLAMTSGDIQFSSQSTTDSNPSSYYPSLSLLNMCKSLSEKSTSPDISSILKDLNSDISPDYASFPLSVYSAEKYKRELGSTREVMCSFKNQTKPCDVTSVQCRIYNELIAVEDSSTPQGRLAQSSNTDINRLLRSMIGSPSGAGLPSQLKQILVSQGIIPQADGTIVAQPDVPERRKDYFSSGAAARASTQTPRTTVAAAATTTNSPTASRAASTPSYRPSDSTSTTTLADSDASPADLSSLDQTKLGDIQNEILRRISAAPKTAPLSASQVRQIVQEEAARRQVPLTSAQATTLASQIQSQAQAPQGIVGGNMANNSAPGLSDDNSSAVTRSAGQRANDQKQAAYGGMAGASGSRGGGGSAAALGVDSSGSGRSSASVPNATISLNVSGDAKNLSEVLKQKFALNDAEASQFMKLLNTLGITDKVELKFVEGQGYQVANTNIAPEKRIQISNYLNQFANRTQKVTRDALIQTIRQPQ